MCRGSAPGAAPRTYIGSPGAGVWYASRWPSADQSYSAAPSRYGREGPPSSGAAQTEISGVAEPAGRRPQNVTRLPSGENPRVRTEGLTSSSGVPRVRFMNRPVPTCVTQTSIRPSRSDWKATKRPSRESAAACSMPSKSVSGSKRASARRRSAPSSRGRRTHTASPARTTAPRAIQVRTRRRRGAEVTGPRAPEAVAGRTTPGASSAEPAIPGATPSPWDIPGVRLRAHASSSLRKA